jgi:hypothetical protein
VDAVPCLVRAALVGRARNVEFLDDLDHTPAIAFRGQQQRDARPVKGEEISAAGHDRDCSEMPARSPDTTTRLTSHANGRSVLSDAARSSARQAYILGDRRVLPGS